MRQRPASACQKPMPLSRPECADVSAAGTSLLRRSISMLHQVISLTV
ncbi:hypothetical protein PANA5342_pPANA10101 (plasmid) [Pantoea ananatis LMG 5342]|nr:hypothetical protein PANA5342_pPANA10101 [Pantoea ananatis LMG 5342]